MNSPRHPPLGTGERWRFAAIGSFVLGLLCLAGVLQPNRNGMGTHQQLGLPPCTFLTIFRVPCPSCGMTTSWSHFMRADFRAAWCANAGGACLAVVAGIAGIWALGVASVGRLFWAPRGDLSLVVAIVLVTVTLVDWVRRLL